MIVKPIFIEIPIKRAIEYYKISRGLTSMNSALKELLADFLKSDIIKQEYEKIKAQLNEKDLELK